ncbi:uncharacterized protein LOC144631489 [Oculina patagonica]
MKVICAGLMKTGTSTLTKALEVLGYTVYHYASKHFDLQIWQDSFETGHLPDFKEVFKVVDAVTDHPQAFWFEEISNAFPEAKIILTVRDSEEAWLKSCQEHLRIESKLLPFYMKILLQIAPSRRKIRHYFDVMHNAIHGSSNPEAGALFRAKYRQHNARVQAVIPAEKLLIYNVKQGWKPLCEFLGCDVPSTEFPRANVGHADTKINMAKEIQQAKLEALLVLIAIASFLLIFFAIALSGGNYYWQKI